MTSRSIFALSLLASPSAFGQTTEELARAHWEAGRDCFKAGRFRDSIVEFEAGNKLSPSNLFGLNIALAYLRLGDKTSAIEAGAAYCRANPQDASHEVCQLIQNTSGTSSGIQRRAAIVGLGFGAGSLATAGVLALVCGLTAARFREAAASNESYETVGVPLSDRYFKASVAGWVTFSVGAATTVLSVVALRKHSAK